MASALITLKLNTTEYDLVRESIDAHHDLLREKLRDTSIPAKHRDFMRGKMVLLGTIRSNLFER